MEIMTARDVSRYLKVNEKKVYRLVRETDIPHMRIGGTLTFAKELIDRWIAEKTEWVEPQTVEALSTHRGPAETPGSGCWTR